MAGGLAIRTVLFTTCIASALGGLITPFQFSDFQKQSKNPADAPFDPINFDQINGAYRQFGRHVRPYNLEAGSDESEQTLGSTSDSEASNAGFTDVAGVIADAASENGYFEENLGTQDTLGAVGAIADTGSSSGASSGNSYSSSSSGQGLDLGSDDVSDLSGGDSYGRSGGSLIGSASGSSFGDSKGNSFSSSGENSFGSSGGSSYGGSNGNLLGSSSGSSFGSSNGNSISSSGGKTFGSSGSSSSSTSGGSAFGTASGSSGGISGGQSTSNSYGGPVQFGQSSAGKGLLTSGNNGQDALSNGQDTLASNSLLSSDFGQSQSGNEFRGYTRPQFQNDELFKNQAPWAGNKFQPQEPVFEQGPVRPGFNNYAFSLGQQSELPKQEVGTDILEEVDTERLQDKLQSTIESQLPSEEDNSLLKPNNRKDTGIYSQQNQQRFELPKQEYPDLLNQDNNQIETLFQNQNYGPRPTNLFPTTKTPKLRQSANNENTRLQEVAQSQLDNFDLRNRNTQPGYSRVTGNDLFQNTLGRNINQDRQIGTDYSQQRNTDNSPGFTETNSVIFTNNDRSNDVFRPIAATKTESDNAQSEGYQFVTNNQFNPPTTFRNQDQVGSDSLITVADPAADRREVISSYVPTNNYVNPKTFIIGPEDKNKIVKSIFNVFRPNLVTEPIAVVKEQQQNVPAFDNRQPVKQEEERESPFVKAPAPAPLPDFTKRNEETFANLGKQNGNLIESFQNQNQGSDDVFASMPSYIPTNTESLFSNQNDDIFDNQNKNIDAETVAEKVNEILPNVPKRKEPVAPKQSTETKIDEGGILDTTFPNLETTLNKGSDDIDEKNIEVALDSGLPDFEEQASKVSDAAKTQNSDTEAAILAEGPLEFRALPPLGDYNPIQASPDSQLLARNRITSETSGLIKHGSQNNLPGFDQNFGAPLINDQNSFFKQKPESSSNSNNNNLYGNTNFDEYLARGPRPVPRPVPITPPSDKNLKPLFDGFTPNSPTTVRDFRSRDLLAGGYHPVQIGNNQPAELDVFKPAPRDSGFSSAAGVSGGGSYSSSNSVSSGDSYNFGGRDQGKLSDRKDQQDAFRNNYDNRVSSENDRTVTNSNTHSNNVNEGKNYDVSNDFSNSVNYSNNDNDATANTYSTRDGYNQGVSSVRQGLAGVRSPLSGIPKNLDLTSSAGLTSSYKPFDVNRQQPLGLSRNGFQI